MYRVGRITVLNLIKKVRKNKQFINELWARDTAKAQKEDAIERKAGHFLLVERPILKAAELRYDLKLDGVSGITDKLVCTVLKERLGMDYRRIKGVSNTANTHKNMILRQQFAYKMIELLQSGKRIINIDETWLNDTNFVRKKWRKRGTSNS